MKQFVISFCGSLAALVVAFVALVALANYVPQPDATQTPASHVPHRSV